MSLDLPPNAHISAHPCLRAKLSQLRSSSTDARSTKLLVHDISLLLGCEALAHGLNSVESGKDNSPLNYEYTTHAISPSRISLMPILRSGLGMIDALQTLLPDPVPVHHLGLFRDKSTMSAVEYYNNLPYHRSSDVESSGRPSELVILVDPVIATGATACAAIETLKEWGVKRIIMISVISSKPGLIRAAQTWPEGLEIWTGAMDNECDERGMIKPGLGDIGDRLFLTIGK